MRCGTSVRVCVRVYTLVNGEHTVSCSGWPVGHTGRSQDRHTRLIVCRYGRHKLRHLLGRRQRTPRRYAHNCFHPVTSHARENARITMCGLDSTAALSSVAVAYYLHGMSENYNNRKKTINLGLTEMCHCNKSNSFTTWDAKTERTAINSSSNCRVW